MSNRNFDSRYVIQRLMDRVNAQNLYGFQKSGVAIINNPQNSDPASYRIASYNAGAETTVDRGLLGGGYSVSLGGIANLIDTVTAVPPEAPTNLVATEGDTTVTISFTPGSDGGAPILNYEYSLDNGITFIAFSPAQTTSPVTISGLTNGTTYNIKIRAVNSTGPSNASATVTATPSGVPGAPTITLITSGNAQLSIAYTAGSTGGQPITNYSYSTDNGTTFKELSPASIANPFTITTISASPFSALVNGTTYQVRIKSININGASPASDASAGTPMTVPSQPVITSISPSSQQLTINYTQSSTGGTAITGYKYSTDNGAHYRSIAVASPLVITTDSSDNQPLVNGTTYQVKIIAVNAKGDSAASTAVNGTPAGLPSDPVLDDVVSGDQSLNVYYTQGSNGGSAITNYYYSTDNSITFVLFSPADTTEPLTITKTSDTNTTLDNFVTYGISIKAVNVAGASGPSNILAGTPSSFTPPTILLAWPGDTEAYIYFTAGNTGPGSSITDYEYSINSSSFASSGSTATPLTITGLTNSTQYSVVIRSKNNLGFTSPNSNIVTVTPTAYVAPAQATLIYDPTQYSGSGPVLNTGSGGTVSGTNNGVALVKGAAGALSRNVFDFSSGDNLAFGNFDFGTSITIMAWVYPRAGGDFTGAINCLIGNTTSNANPSGFKFGWNWYDTSAYRSRSIFMEAGNGTQGGATNSVTNTVQYNQWQLLTYVFDRTNARAIYFWNGQPADMINISTVSNIGMNNANFRIGTFTNGTYWMNAQLGVINVYKNTLLTGAQILQYFNDTKYDYILPAPPTALSGVPDDQQATINFTPGNDGGSAITNYQYSTDNGTTFRAFSPATGVVSSVSITTLSTDGTTALTNGTPYTIKLRAVNANGTSIDSSSVVVTPDVPGDRIVQSLTTSLAAYNAAATDDWVKITSTEWANLQTNVSGTSKSGAIDSYLTASTVGNFNGTSAVLGANSETATNPAIPANNYLYGFAVYWTNTAPTVGMRVYTNTNSSVYTGFNQVGSELPPTTSSGISYYVRKSVSQTNGTGKGLLACFSGTKLDYSGFGGSAAYFGYRYLQGTGLTTPILKYTLDATGSVPSSNSSLSGTLANFASFGIQGLSTATKQWD